MPEIRHHSLWLRLTHWINLLCLVVLLMSGMQIFDAHRALYWGIQSHFVHPILALPHGFPFWITLPDYQDLAAGRHWHFFFAWVFVLNGAVYLIAGLLGGHIRRHLLLSRAQFRGLGQSVREHLHLRFPHGDAAGDYNPLQKLSYVIVVLVLLPMMVLTGLTMSPAMDTAAPILLHLFGGRQSARTIHFLIAALLVGFTLVHVAMVLLSGFIRNMRGMITGTRAAPEDAAEYSNPT